MSVTRDELVEHVARLVSAMELPLNVDAERCFADDTDGVAETVRLLAEAGASGCSIEDLNPAAARIDDLDCAAARVAAAADAARESGLVLTARCEHHLHGVDDLEATIIRLGAYCDAGADVVYAPGLVAVDDIRRVVDAAGVPVNVLALPGGPTVAELAAAGARRVSVGSAVSSAAYAAVIALGRALLADGVVPPGGRHDSELVARAVGA